MGLDHNVYFTLRDSSDQKIEELIAACKKYLTDHPGLTRFAVGRRNPDLDRPVNDDRFDVSLHVSFDSLASHDKYQEAPRHKQFIEENNGNWAEVRVFDTDLA